MYDMYTVYVGVCVCLHTCTHIHVYHVDVHVIVGVVVGGVGYANIYCLPEYYITIKTIMLTR